MKQSVDTQMSFLIRISWRKDCTKMTLMSTKTMLGTTCRRGDIKTVKWPHSVIWFWLIGVKVAPCRNIDWVQTRSQAVSPLTFLSGWMKLRPPVLCYLLQPVLFWKETRMQSNAARFYFLFGCRVRNERHCCEEFHVLFPTTNCCHHFQNQVFFLTLSLFLKPFSVFKTILFSSLRKRIPL